MYIVINMYMTITFVNLDIKNKSNHTILTIESLILKYMLYILNLCHITSWRLELKSTCHMSHSSVLQLTFMNI
jgi:hypothetical protein